MTQAANRRARNRVTLLAAKSKPCLDCGLSFPFDRMWLFHERGVKRFSVGSSCDKSGKAVAEEIAKCDTVCYRCGPKRSAALAARMRGIKRALVMPRPGPAAAKAALSLTQMLRRESRKMDARERRRLHSTKAKLDHA